MTGRSASAQPKRSSLPLYALFTLLCASQLVFWNFSRGIMPDMGIVPDVPSHDVVQALSLGDEQFYFRVLALDIQNSGDTYGRFTPLKDYDYAKLSEWFNLLDMLDSRSDYIPSLATYYFSQTQNTPDVRYVVDYLYAHGVRDPQKKWWWLLQAVYLANHKLEDKDLALRVGEPLIDTQGIPLWARHFPAFIYEQRGEPEMALYIMEHVLENAGKEELTREEFNFMKYFIEERLEREAPGLLGQMAPAVMEDAAADEATSDGASEPSPEQPTP